MTANQVAELLLDIKAMTFRFDTPYVYTTGLKSPVYLDNRLVLSYPKVRTKIIDEFVRVIKNVIGLKNSEWISATASAAIPYGASVADRLNLPLIYVRPTTKSYGKGGKIEGYLRKGSKVIIIEDHVSTAASVGNNAQAIREAGSKVKYCIATTTYETQKSKETLAQAGIKLIALTTGKIIVETALKKGLITDEEKKKIDEWFADPPNWAKKMGFE